jgi:hypothetical protein
MLKRQRKKFLKEEKGIKVEYTDSCALPEAIDFGISSLFQTCMVLINVTDDTFVDIVSDNCNLYLHEK